MTPLDRWTRCKSCRLWRTRRRVVLGMGERPADIMFVGEGPGVSEDMVGVPFVGPSGRLLHEAFSDAADMAEMDIGHLRFWLTNTVYCRPCDSQDAPNRTPRPDELFACSVRFREEANYVKPKRVVYVGAVAEKSYRGLFRDAVKITHPAALLRMGGSSNPAYVVMVRTLAEVYLSLPSRDPMPRRRTHA